VDRQPQAVNGGAYDQWIPAKSAGTMAYLTRDDIPFHYALADASPSATRTTAR